MKIGLVTEKRGLLYPLLKGWFGLSVSDVYKLTSTPKKVLQAKLYPTNLHIRLLATDDSTLNYPGDVIPSWWSYGKLWNVYKEDFYRELNDYYVSATLNGKIVSRTSVDNFIEGIHGLGYEGSSLREVIITFDKDVIEIERSLDDDVSKLIIKIKEV